MASGLNIKGTCENEDCFGYKGTVWVQKGYGTFNYGKMITGNSCPSCNKKMSFKSFTNLGYLRAKVHIKGIRMDG